MEGGRRGGQKEGRVGHGEQMAGRIAGRIAIEGRGGVQCYNMLVHIHSQPYMVFGTDQSRTRFSAHYSKIQRI